MYIYTYKTHIYTYPCMYAPPYFCTYILISISIDFICIYTITPCTQSMYKCVALMGFCIVEPSTTDIAHGLVTQHKKMLDLLVDNRYSTSRHPVFCWWTIRTLLVFNQFSVSRQLGLLVHNTVFCRWTISTLPCLHEHGRAGWGGPSVSAALMWLDLRKRNNPACATCI